MTYWRAESRHATNELIIRRGSGVEWRGAAVSALPAAEPMLVAAVDRASIAERRGGVGL